jgi:hypothetical protein
VFRLYRIAPNSGAGGHGAARLGRDRSVKVTALVLLLANVWGRVAWPLPTSVALTVAEIDATMAYAEAEKALATRQAYASDCVARLRRLVRLQGRYSPAGARGHRRRLSVVAR